MLKKLNNKNLIATIAILTLLLLVLSGCGQTSQPVTVSKGDNTSQGDKAPAKLSDVSFRLDFIAAGYDAPFVVAREKGFYKEQGLNVTIREGTGSATTGKLVANGSDTFGLLDGGTLLRAVAQEGIPIKAVFGYSQKNPLAIVSLEESGITKGEQLKGKTVAVVPGGADSQMLPAFLGAAGLKAEDVKVANIDANAKLQVLMDKKADAIVGWINYQVPQLQAKGYDINSIMLAEYGVNSMSLVIAANQKTLSSDPQLVEKFITATKKGIEYAQANPDESIQLLKKSFPNIDEGIAKNQLMATYKLTHSTNTEGKPLGWMATKDWQDTADVLQKFSGMKENVAPDKVFSNDFIK